MASKRISMVSLSQLLAEVDMLERELKDLSREAQRGEDFNNQLQEIVERDLKNVEAIQKETNRISQEILEWESKERFLTDAVNTGIQSSQLLVQMETQARNKLEEERGATSLLKDQLRCEVETFAKKVEKEEIAYGKIPEYVHIIQIEERIRSKLAMLQSLEREKIQVMGQIEAAAKDVSEDREAWRGFKASCLNLAGQWLKMRKLRKETETLRKEKEDMNLQIIALESERNLVLDKSAFHNNVGHGPNYEAERENDDHALSGILSVPKPSVPNVASGQYSSNANSSSTSTHSADTDTVPTNLEKPSLMNNNLSSISGHPSLPPPATMFKPPSTAANYVPPTPRTKKLHLQLGTSLLNKRKAGSSVPVSASASIGLGKNNSTSKHQAMDEDLTPSTSPAITIEKDIAKVSSSQIHEIAKPLKTRSFKLGLTSLFSRKKPSSVVQVSKPNEELLARTPTLPHHDQGGVRDNYVKENVEEKMDVEEEDVEKDRRKSCQVDSITKRNKYAENVQQEKEVDTVSTGVKPADANYLSCRPTVEEVVHIDDVSSNENAIQNQQLSILPEVTLPNVVPTLPIPTQRKSTKPMEVSSSPSPREAKQPMCVSPGTALSDQKRKAVLQQLLESPQTVNGSNFNSSDRGFGIVDEKGAIISGAEKSDRYFVGERGNKNVDGNVQSNTENSFSFFGGGSGKIAEENAGEGIKSSLGDGQINTENSFSFFGGGSGKIAEENAGEGSKSPIGDGQVNTESSFSFFGGESGNMAGENVGDESFAFSFGGVDGEQDTVQDGGDSFGFSFGGDFEKQVGGGGGFSLF